MPRHLILLVACLSLAPSINIALEAVNPDLNATAQAVLDELAAGYGERVLCGYNTYVHTPDDYQQTAKHGAVQGFDLNWYGDGQQVIAVWQAGIIPTLHWHWSFDGDSAWRGKRSTPVDVDAMVTEGTATHQQAITELAEIADTLQILEDADVPVLFRPLHEIDGGWFWWTDKDDPTNTAALWKMIYHYLTDERGLDNLIWVYSAGVGNKTVDYRKLFYPGADYVDISGIDIYNVDFETGAEADKYWSYWNDMQEVSPGKMLALGECEAMPNPDLMADNTTPRWLYAMPWYGVGSGWRSHDWGRFEMWHELVATADEMPSYGQDCLPNVGLVAPLDDGSAWYPTEPPTFEAYAVDRGGQMDQVLFRIDGEEIGSVSEAPYRFTWSAATPGCYDLDAVAVDTDGNRSVSNTVRIVVGLRDLAEGRPATVSSNSDRATAITDGDSYSAWGSDKSASEPDEQWIQIDLGATQTIDRVNLLWGWKIFATAWTIEVNNGDPEFAEDWQGVQEESDFSPSDWTWKVTRRIQFDPVDAQHLRIRFHHRKQNWGGYNLTAVQVPVPVVTTRRIDIELLGADALPAIDPAAALTPTATGGSFAPCDPGTTYTLSFAPASGG